MDAAKILAAGRGADMDRTAQELLAV